MKRGPPRRGQHWSRLGSRALGDAEPKGRLGRHPQLKILPGFLEPLGFAGAGHAGPKVTLHLPAHVGINLAVQIRDEGFFVLAAKYLTHDAFSLVCDSPLSRVMPLASNCRRRTERP